MAFSLLGVENWTEGVWRRPRNHSRSHNELSAQTAQHSKSDSSTTSQGVAINSASSFVMYCPSFSQVTVVAIVLFVNQFGKDYTPTQIHTRTHPYISYKFSRKSDALSLPAFHGS